MKKKIREESIKKAMLLSLAASLFLSSVVPVWAVERMSQSSESVETQLTSEQSTTMLESLPFESIKEEIKSSTLEATESSEQNRSSSSESIETTVESSDKSSTIQLIQTNNVTADTYVKYVTLKSAVSRWTIDNNTVKSNGDMTSFVNQTLKVTKEQTVSGTLYYMLADNKGNELGFVKAADVATTDNIGGTYQADSKYVTIISPNYTIWQNFNWQKRADSSTYNGQTLQARGYYIHFNGSRYLTLYDNQGRWVGYINENAVQVANNGGGIYKSYGKYVTITSPNYTIWQNFNWQKRADSSTYNGQTLQARGYYDHFNGSRYLTLYDNQGRWVGYINENATQVANNSGGIYKSYGKYVTVRSPNYTIWQNFSWRKKANSSTYYGQVLLARGYYDHFNGSRYLTLYDNQGNWVGYINENATKLEATAGGTYKRYGKYVTISHANLDIFQNFDFKKRAHTSQYINQTFEARGYYDHFNGTRYLSLYDNTGKWIGYLAENGVKVANNQAGVEQSVTAAYKVIKNNYNLWENFSWQKKQSSSALVGKVYQARAQYHHFNGSVYLSLFDEFGVWQGYINAKATLAVSASEYVNKETLQNLYTSAAAFNQGSASTIEWNNFKQVLAKAKLALQSRSQAEVNQAANELDQVSKKQFIDFLAPDAKSIAGANDLYPSVMLAQAILESNYGRSELAINAKNIFGIKFVEGEDNGKYQWYEVNSLEYINGEYVSVKSKFRKYTYLSESLKDNALKLSKGVSWDPYYYKGAWRSQTKTYQDATKALTGKYATDPTYNEKLNRVIVQWNLTQYD